MRTLFLFLLLPILIFSQELQVKGGTYTSTADTLAITGIGFQPEFVLVKLNTTTYPVWKCTAHHPDSSSVGGAVDIDDGIISLDADGFTLGVDGSVQTGTTAGAWIAVAGEKIATGSYIGTGSQITITTGWQPGLFIWKVPTATSSQIKTSLNTGSNAMGFVDAEAGNFFTFTPTGLTTSAIGHLNGRKYIWIAIEDNPLFYADTAYTGNATDNRDFSTKFAAGAVFAKRTNASAAVFWKLKETVGETTYRFDNVAHTATNAIQSITTELFQIGSGTAVNANTAPYYAWYLRSYTIPVEEESATGKFKGNDYFDRFKGW